jgi:hypothetical protein
MNRGNVSIVDHAKRCAGWFDKEDAKVVALILGGPICIVGLLSLFLLFLEAWQSFSNQEKGALFFLGAFGLVVGAVWLLWHLVKWLIIGAGALGLFCAGLGGIGFVLYIVGWIVALPIMLVLAILTGLFVTKVDKLDQVEQLSSNP